MTESELQRRMLSDLRLRVEPEMAKYILQHSAEPRVGARPPGDLIPVMGADARTGVPLRQMVDPRRFFQM